MKRGVALLALVVGVGAAAVAAAFAGAIGPSDARASSHREAPLIGDDPSADNTDVYAFVSPDAPNTVTLIANYIPFEDPAGGPNYYRFDPSVLYELHIDNNGDARDDVTYQFRFRTSIANRNTFLYNTGPVTSPTDPDLNVKQTFTVTRVAQGRTVLGSDLPVPPANIGPRSNPSYDPYQGVVDLGGGRKVFAGPRDDPFFVDLGLDLRSRRATTVQPCSPHPARRRGGSGRGPELQHAHDCDPGAEDGSAQGTRCGRHDRRLRQRQQARRSACSAATARSTRRDRSCRSPGSGTRS